MINYNDYSFKYKMADIQVSSEHCWDPYQNFFIP